MTKKKTFKSFAVHGCRYANKDMKITRLDWIKKYVQYGAKFVVEREPDNEHDENAIKVKHALKSGKKMMVGYVPRKLAAEWAPLMDEYGWIPDVKFQIKFIAEKADEEKGVEIGDCTGMMLRYPIR